MNFKYGEITELKIKPFENCALGQASDGKAFNKPSIEYDKSLDVHEDQDIKELIVDYYDDLREKSPFPEDIPDSDASWEKIAPEETREKREEFDDIKTELIKQWELTHDTEWPRYNENVYDEKTGTMIRCCGARYDCHHIKPLTYDGQNESTNITPLHANDHYDKRGVHSPESPFGKIEALNKER